MAWTPVAETDGLQAGRCQLFKNMTSKLSVICSKPLCVPNNYYAKAWLRSGIDNLIASVLSGSLLLAVRAVSMVEAAFTGNSDRPDLHAAMLAVNLTCNETRHVPCLKDSKASRQLIFYSCLMELH